MSGRLALAAEAAPWGVPALFLAAGGIYDLTAGHPVIGGAETVIALLFAWLAYRRVRYLHHGQFRAARETFVKAAQTLPMGTTCLARDDHVVLFRSKQRIIGLPVMRVMRLNEDDAAEFAEHGNAVLTGITFAVSPLHVRVIQIIHGDRFITGPDGEPELEKESLSRWARARRAARIFRAAGRPEGYAECAEITELAAQIHAAEPLGEAA